MRKSIFFWEIKHLGGVADGAYDEAFAALKRIGIEGFQLSVRDIEKVGERNLLCAMTRNGMCADVIHTVIPLLSADDDIFRDAIRAAEETIALLHRFSCTRLMIVALPVTDVKGEGDRERAMARMIEGLAEIVKIAQAEGIEIYIENFSKPLLPYTAVSDIEQILDAVPQVKYTFDVGNFICAGIDPFAAYERLHARVSLLHLKNFTPTEDERGIPCADGHYVEGVAFDQGEFQ